MGKERTKLSDNVFEAVSAGMVEALKRGTIAWPLPQPPMSDPDFPPIAPKSPEAVIEQGIGILQMDRAMFESNLNTVVDLIVPHRMNLSDDPFTVHQKWLHRRVDKVAESLLFTVTTDWLAQAFDHSAPNTDRWWLAISLLNGLSTTPHGQPVHQGYHLVESITLAERPGTWHTQPDAGPHQSEWNPHAVIPRNSGVVAHDAGVTAARWLIEKLENDSLDRRLLLMEWVRLLLQRPNLIEPLDLVSILLRRASDPEAEVAARVTLCLAKAIEFNRDSGLELAKRLHQRDELLVKRGMADVLTRMFRRLEWDAVPFLTDMLADQDEGVLAAASATVGDLRFLDSELWADTIAKLAQHPLPIVRRNLVPFLRDYIEQYPEDDRRLLPILWQDGDEVVRTRMRELLMRMEEVSPDHFAARLLDFKKQGCPLEPLWETLAQRRPERGLLWQDWFTGEGEQPTLPVSRPPPHSDMDESGELPSVEDAYQMLDQELGFIDD